MSVQQSGLVGDIGATNARFALVEPNGAIVRAGTFLCEDHASLADALAAYLRQHDGAKPTRAVLAVATSPQADLVSFTNNPWTFSVAELKAQLGLERLASSTTSTPTLFPFRTSRAAICARSVVANRTPTRPWASSALAPASASAPLPHRIPDMSQFPAKAATSPWRQGATRKPP